MGHEFSAIVQAKFLPVRYRRPPGDSMMIWQGAMQEHPSFN